MKYLLLSMGIAGIVLVGSFLGVKFYSHQVIAPQKEVVAGSSAPKPGVVASSSVGGDSSFKPTNFRGPQGSPSVVGPSGPPPSTTKP